MEDEVSLGLAIMDRQLIDRHGVPCGKVDDLELQWPAAGGPPFVSAIVTGPGALARRVNRRLGRVLSAFWTRLHPEGREQPILLSWGTVALIDYEVHLSVSRRQGGLTGWEDWVRDQMIGKIPGASSDVQAEPRRER